jgi:hypothetical protein
MQISKVHASMRDEIRSQGPLVNAQTGLRSRHNRGVRRAWKANKRQKAEQRQVESELLRPQNAKRLRKQVNALIQKAQF